MSTGARNMAYLVPAGIIGAFVGIFVLRLLPAGIVLPFFVLLFAGFAFFFYKMFAGNQPETQATEAERALALNAGPRADLATVFVYREGFVGKAVGFDVQLDGKPHAQLKSPRFTTLYVSPGPHTLTAGPKGFAASQNRPGEMTFTAAAGEILAFHIEVSMGALKNQVNIVRDPETRSLPLKLASMTMTIPARVGLDASAVAGAASDTR